MAIFYSATTGGFHDSTLQAPPAGAIEISAAHYRALMDAQSSGFRIVAGQDGAPVAVDPDSVITPEQALARLRRQRDKLLTASDHVMLPDFPATAEQRAEWALYRQQLRDLPEAAADPAAAKWPTPPAS